MTYCTVDEGSEGDRHGTTNKLTKYAAAGKENKQHQRVNLHHEKTTD